MAHIRRCSSLRCKQVSASCAKFLKRSMKAASRSSKPGMLANSSWDVGVQCTSRTMQMGNEIHHVQLLYWFSDFGAVLSCTTVSHLALMCCAAKAPFSFIALLEVILGLTASVLAEARASLIEGKRIISIDQTGLLRLENKSCRDHIAPVYTFQNQHLITTVVLPIECKPRTKLMVCCTMPTMSTTTSARTTKEERRRDRKPRPRGPLPSLLTKAIWPCHLPLWAK